MHHSIQSVEDIKPEVYRVVASNAMEKLSSFKPPLKQQISPALEQPSMKQLLMQAIRAL